MKQKTNFPKIKTFFIFIFLIVFLLLIHELVAIDIAAAATKTGPTGTGSTGSTSNYGLTEANAAAGLKTDTIPTYLGRFAGAALALSGSIFLFLVVYGAIIMMTAAGNTETIGKGKKIITWAVIGALILGAAYALTQLVFQIFT